MSLHDELLPIVSLAGDPELHQRAQQYNQRMQELADAKQDLVAAHDWNTHQRFSTALLGSTKPPVTTHIIRARINALSTELALEREEILKLSKGTAKP